MGGGWGLEGWGWEGGRDGDLRVKWVNSCATLNVFLAGTLEFTNVAFEEFSFIVSLQEVGVQFVPGGIVGIVVRCKFKG